MFSKKLLSLVPQLNGISFETDPVMKIYANYETAMRFNGHNVPIDAALVILSGAFAYHHSGDKTSHLVMSEDVGSVLTDSEIMAVTLHEIGHIKAGHLDVQGVETAGYINKVENELQADRYAIKNGATAFDLWNGTAKLTVAGTERLVQLCQSRNMNVQVTDSMTLEKFNNDFENGHMKEMDPVSTARFEALRRYF